ncbi:type II TA system antitoxin MqsA family protein [Clostridium sp. DL1XJH146]
MKENMVFCVECRDDVHYTVTEEKMVGTLKGETYEYKGKVAHCECCGEEIFVDEVSDFNLKALYDAFREKNCIISLEKILEIPKKYAIGKRPLSLLLGWGEQTFSRYCDGDMPTKQYSETLQQIYDDPNYFKTILEENKTNLKTTSSYDKSKRAVDNLIGIKIETKMNIDLVVRYLLNQCEDITPLALQKVLYYIQGFYYAFYKTFIFENNCEAWVHGPVYREIYNKYSSYHFDPIKKADEFDTTIFMATQKSVIDCVIKNLCCYSGKVLERFTHLESPWLETRKDLPDYMSSNRVIDKMLIGKYFIAVKEKYNMLTPADIKEYTQIKFEEL